MMSYELIEYRSAGTMAEAVADRVAECLAKLISGQGRARIAVPGGTTPGPMLTALGAMDLDWERVAVTLTDERWVPSSSDRSNQRLLSETLFAGRAAAAEFVPLYGGTAEPAQAMEAVGMALRQIALPLDIAVLGMGDDMHTASLFPGAVGLDAALAEDAPPCLAITAPGQPEPRVTLSAPVLRAAGERHILLKGAAKRAALEEAAEIRDPRRAPIAAVLDGAIVHLAEPS